jgi:hypothetical protein
MGLHASLEFLQFELFVEKADLIEWSESLLELSGVVFYKFFKGLITIYEFEEGVIHYEIIETNLLLIFIQLGLFICLLKIHLIKVVP